MSRLPQGGEDRSRTCRDPGPRHAGARQAGRRLRGRAPSALPHGMPTPSPLNAPLVPPASGPAKAPTCGFAPIHRHAIRPTQRDHRSPRRHNPHSGIGFNRRCHTRRGFLLGGLSNAYPHPEVSVRSSSCAGRHRTTLSQSRRWAKRVATTGMLRAAATQSVEIMRRRKIPQRATIRCHGSALRPCAATAQGFGRAPQALVRVRLPIPDA